MQITFSFHCLGACSVGLVLLQTEGEPFPQSKINESHQVHAQYHRLSLFCVQAASEQAVHYQAIAGIGRGLRYVSRTFHVSLSTPQDSIFSVEETRVQ